VEVDVSGDGGPDVAGNQGQDEKKKKSSSTDQTRQSEVSLIRGL